MRHGARLLLLLLLAATYATAGLPKLSAHAPHLDGHEDGHEAAGPHGHGLADQPAGLTVLQVLLHGHAHSEPVSAHSHGIAPTIPSRLDLPGCQLRADLGALPRVAVEPLRSASFETLRPTAPGVGPPARLHWLCTLLI